MTGNAIEVRSLSFSFDGKKVLEEVSLTVPRGEFAIVAGPNGSGKTTLLRCILGFYRPREGEVLLFGHPAWRRSRLHEEVQYAAEACDLPLAWSLRALGRWLTLAGTLTRAQLRALEEAASAAGLPLSQPLGTLSRGQRSFAQLLLALAGEPALLLLDEPTLGMDAVYRKRALEALLAFVAESPTTVLLATQDLPLAERLGQQLFMLQQGRVVAAGPLDALKTRYAVVEGNVAAELPPGAARVLAREPRLGGQQLLLELEDPHALASWASERGLAVRQPSLAELAECLWQEKEENHA
jgi:ABC-type multidrug transport system ATPase subunit